MSQPAPDNAREIGQRLRAMRLRYLIRQRDLAERIGVQTPAISRWEGGSRGLSVATLLAIAETLGVPAAELLPTQHQRSAPASEPQQAPSLEESAIASIAAVLRQRPDLIVDIMDVIERKQFDEVT